MSRIELGAAARFALSGVGDRSKEWIEITDVAYHVRRRLTIAEEECTGPALDIRGTPEARRRFEAIRHALPPIAIHLAVQEAGAVVPLVVRARDA